MVKRGIDDAWSYRYCHQFVYPGPWVEEMISVAWKHPNVYIGSDAYAPKYWKPEFIHFINSWGQNKVLFGTDFPIVDFERATREIDELGFREEAKEKLLWKNAASLYGLGPKDGFYG